MQALHQAVSLGELRLITILTDKMNANINSKMHNNLSVVHCAAQTYAGALSLIVLSERFNVSMNQ